MKKQKTSEVKTLEEYRKKYDLKELIGVDDREYESTDFGINLAKESVEKYKKMLKLQK